MHDPVKVNAVNNRCGEIDPRDPTGSTAMHARVGFDIYLSSYYKMIETLLISNFPIMINYEGDAPWYMQFDRLRVCSTPSFYSFQFVLIAYYVD